MGTFGVENIRKTYKNLVPLDNQMENWLTLYLFNSVVEYLKYTIWNYS